MDIGVTGYGARLESAGSGLRVTMVVDVRIS